MHLFTILVEEEEEEEEEEDRGLFPKNYRVDGGGRGGTGEEANDQQSECIEGERMNEWEKGTLPNKG